MSGLVLAGDFYFGFFNASNQFLGYIDQVVNVTSLELTPGDGTELNRTSRNRTTFGQNLDSVVLPAGYTMSLTTDEVTSDTLRLAFLGNYAALAVSSGTFTDQVVTARHDTFVPIGTHIDLTDGTVVVTGPSGTPSYTAGTDYVVDLRNGLFKALSTGSIADGGSAEVDGGFGARSGFTISGAAQQSIKIKGLLDGRNLANNDRVRVEIFEATLRPAAGVDLKGDDFLSIQAEGSLITPAGQTSPFIYYNLGADA